jgi:predicted RND superfamily exporter protein
VTALALRRRGLVLAVLGVVTVLAVAGVARLRTAVGYRAFLGERHPIVRTLDDFVDRFGGGVPVVAVWSCRDTPACETAVDARSLAMAADVAARLATVDGVLRVDSPATSPLLVAPAIGLPESRRLTRHGRPVADAAALARQALASRLWRGQLLSEDGTAGAIVVQLASTDGATSRRVVAALDAALRPHEAAGFQFALVGGPVEFVVAGAELARAMRRIVPLMVALIAAVLIVVVGAPRATGCVLGAVGLVVVWTLGLAGWIGWPETSLTQALPPLLLVVGVCDGVHLFGAVRRRPAGEDPAARVRGAADEVRLACLMTSVTTMAGFGSLATSGLESIARFGILAALGVGAAFVVTFTVVPIGFVWTSAARATPAGRAGRLGEVAARIGAAVARRAGVVLAAVVVLVLVAAAGVGRVRFDATFADLYGKESRVVRWAETVGRTLRRPDTLELAIRAPAARPSPTPPAEAFRVLDALARSLRGIGALGREWSILDPMRELNGMVHRDPLVLDGREDDRGRPGSLLRLVASEEPALVRRWVAADGMLRLSVEADKVPQDALTATLAAVRARAAAVVPAGWTLVVTGPLAVVQEMLDEIRATQLTSFAWAVVVVGALIGLFFRSVAATALVMLLALLPVEVTLGLMGWAGVPLDVGSAMVAAVVLGIAVDDAIHVMVAWRRRARAGEPPLAAALTALRVTGPPVIGTSVALAAGFATLLLSPWHSIAAFGLTASLAILLSLGAVLLVLPAIAACVPARSRAQ